MPGAHRVLPELGANRPSMTNGSCYEAITITRKLPGRLPAFSMRAFWTPPRSSAAPGPDDQLLRFPMGLPVASTMAGLPRSQVRTRFNRGDERPWFMVIRDVR